MDCFRKRHTVPNPEFQEYDKVDKIRGMDICICTTATTDEEAKELLTMVGAPFYA